MNDPKSNPELAHLAHLAKALLAGAAKNRECLEKLNELQPGAMMPYAHKTNDYGGPCLTLPCARCTNGRCEIYGEDGHPARRERCAVCGGTGRLLTYTGAEIAAVIALLLAPQLHVEATDEAIASFNQRVRGEQEERKRAEEAARRERAAELRAAADQVANDPTLFERFKALLGGEARK